MSTIMAHPYIFAIPFTLLVVGSGFFFVWLAEKSAARPLLQSCAGIVSPFSGLMALLFGLFAVFLANDVSIHVERARAAVAREADAMTIVLSIADALGDRGRTLKQLAVEFGKKSATGDWRSARQTAEAQDLNLKMLSEVLFGGLSTIDPQVRQAVQAGIIAMRAARGEMNAVAHSRTAWPKWLAALILCIMTQAGVVVVHLDKPRAAMLAVTLFGIGMAFTMWVIFIRIDPYAGRHPVSLSPIEAAYTRSVPQ
jgi:hypothetical protein